jgi:hypothetical protein
MWITREIANALAKGFLARTFRQFLISIQYTLFKNADSAAFHQSSSAAGLGILTPNRHWATSRTGAVIFGAQGVSLSPGTFL